MSDLTYRWARRFSYPAFWVSSRPLVLHVARARITGGYILASTHLSPLDTPVLIRHTPRNLDFMSIVEMKSRRIVLWYFRLFNTFFLDRSRTDPGATLAAVHRLQNGRVVAMFPEGTMRTLEKSVIRGGPMKPGVAGIAQLADVPVVPVVVLGADGYHRILNWAPIFKVRYGVIYGQPIRVRTDLEKSEARVQFMDQLRESYKQLAGELAAALGRTVDSHAPDDPSAANG